MKNIVICVLILILLLVILVNYSKSGFDAETEYVDLVYKMLSENKTTMDILKALQEKGAQMDKLPTYITMGQMKLSAEKSPASTTEAPPVAETMQAPAPASA